MKTAVTTYIRGNKSITTIGVSHIGSKQYYSEVGLILGMFNPQAVLYEGVKNDVDDRKLLGNAFENFATVLGLSMQKECIPNNPEWVKSDLPLSTLNSAYGGVIDIFTISDEQIEQMFELMKKYPKTFKRLFKILLTLRTVFKNKKRYTVIDTLRNYKVILDTFELLKEHDDIAIYYGQDHFKQICKYLESVGFRATGRRVMDAFSNQ